jgi:hypothetical protein
LRPSRVSGTHALDKGCHAVGTSEFYRLRNTHGGEDVLFTGAVELKASFREAGFSSRHGQSPILLTEGLYCLSGGEEPGRKNLGLLLRRGEHRGLEKDHEVPGHDTEKNHRHPGHDRWTGEEGLPGFGFDRRLFFLFRSDLLGGGLYGFLDCFFEAG